MDLVTAVVILAALAAVGVLGGGIVSMIHGGLYDRLHADQFMVARVGLQAVAFGLILLGLFVVT